MDWIITHLPLLLAIAKPLVLPLLIFATVLPLLVLLERRGAAYIQDRIGPNRAFLHIQPNLPGIFKGDKGGLRIHAFGMIFNLADAVKLFFKESFIPSFAHRGWYLAATFIPFGTGLMTVACIPWFGPIVHEQTKTLITGSALEGNAGLLILFAIASLSVYGIVLGSWASNSKFSLLGGMRASAMMISYEVSMGLSVLGLLMVYHTFSLSEMAVWQEQHTWGIVVQPIGFLLFTVAMFAECNRNPFDVAEGESEIVAGFHTEYNGARFMLFMAAEYLHMVVASALIAVLFLGGWSLLPFPLPIGGGAWQALDGDFLRTHLGSVASVLFVITALLVGFIGFAVLRRMQAYRRRPGSDATHRVREYRLFTGVFFGLAAALLVAAVLCWGVGNTPINDVMIDGQRRDVWSPLVDLLAVLVQFHVVVAKTMLVAGLFIWVRWTLPRFRYDQIMGLGWKVLLNIALVNLAITALVVQLVKGN